MPRDAPDLDEIFRTVDEFLADLGPRVDGGDRYQLLCVRYLLGIVQREVRDGPQIDREELALFSALPESLGLEAVESLAERYRILADAIAQGQLDSSFGEVLELLLTHVKNKVEISDPEFLSDSRPVEP